MQTLTLKFYFADGYRREGSSVYNDGITSPINIGEIWCFSYLQIELLRR